MSKRKQTPINQSSRENTCWSASGDVFQLVGVPAIAGSPEEMDLRGGSAPCLRIIREASSYEGEEPDPHGDEMSGLVVQHLVEDNARELARKVERERAGLSRKPKPTLLEGALKELAIKMDVDAQCCTLFRQSLEHMRGAWSFGIVYDVEERELASGNTNLRGYALIPPLFDGMYGASFCRASEHKGWYAAGLAKKGMQPKLQHATVLREVRAAPGSQLVFPDALDFLDADYVRLRLLAVSPYPIKYLREWVREKNRVAGRGVN